MRLTEQKPDTLIESAPATPACQGTRQAHGPQRGDGRVPLAAVNGLLRPASLRQAVLDSVPEAFRELNGRAFDKGDQYGQALSQTIPPVVSEEDYVRTLETH